MAVLQLSALSTMSIGYLNPSFSALKKMLIVNGYNKIDN